MSSLIALDIGEKRIGVAIADITAPFPAPLITLEASERLAAEFASILQSYKVTGVVVGFPRNQKGEPTAQTERVKQIVGLLNIPENIAVYWQDESLTSVKAEAELKKRKKHYQKAEVDALAATYILEDFIREQKTTQTETPSHPNESAKKTPTPVPDKKKLSKKKPHKSKKAKKHILLFIALAIFGVFTLALIGSYSWYNNALSPRTKDDMYSLVTIKSGTSRDQIARELEEKKLINSATAFLLYVRLNGINTLQAGQYRLSSKQSTQQITEIIEKGKVTTVSVLISPGQRLDQILASLEKEGYTKQDLEAALEVSRDHPALKGLPNDVLLEGYLFPDTYTIEPNTSAKQLITTILDNFEKRVTPEIREGIAAQGLNMRQAVILASVIQKEVPEPEVQRKVAQVFIKRLKEGKMLGSDVTYMYAAALSGETATPSLNSPYNTRKVTGLPPTAISNFNLSALQAVANPTDTDYLFFVAGDDGTTHFSRTLEEHEALVEKYCHKLCN